MSRTRDGMRRIQLGKGGVGPLSELISVQLRSANVLLSRGLSQATEDRGLKPGSVSALSLVVAYPGISQTDVGHIIGIDRSTMVEVVDTLEARGWLTREKPEVDRRRYSLFATEAGTGELKAIIAWVGDFERATLGDFAAEELELLLSLLNRMRAACRATIGQTDAPPPMSEKIRRI